ncbi:MAG: hypothetical protein WBG50_14795 [Desulfomonilaceae bacterium]
MKKLLVTAWLTALWFLLLGNVHAWEVPAFLRLSAGYRMWFSVLQGDLIQSDRTKLDIIDNVGVDSNKLVWEYFANFRLDNIHVFRFRCEPNSLYGSRNNSFQRIRYFQLGYDCDFYMTPQTLLGANCDLGILNTETRVSDVTVANSFFDYSENQTRTIPTLGLHGSFYPIIEGISLRPCVSGRADWWNYKDLETWDWEVSGSVDIPVNSLWTWTVNSGYRMWHVKSKRDRDTIDINRTGFFIESSVLF